MNASNIVAKFDKRLGVFLALGLVGVLALVTAFYLFTGRQSEAFPSLAAGGYLGTIEGAAVGSSDAKVEFYLERHEGSPHAFFVLIHADWEPQRVRLETNSDSGSVAVPLRIQGPDEEYWLVGGSTSRSAFGGGLYAASRGRIGGWHLTGIAELPVEELLKNEDEVRASISLQSQIDTTEQRLRLLEESVPRQSQEIEKLTAYIAEGSQLRARAEEKLSEAESKLVMQQKVLDEHRADVEGLQAKLELSYQVTPMGKLVSLARRSLERESRWVKSQLVSQVSEMSPQVERGVARGKKVLALQKQIALEKRRIEMLQTGSHTSSPLGRGAYGVEPRRPQ